MKPHVQSDTSFAVTMLEAARTALVSAIPHFIVIDRKERKIGMVGVLEFEIG